jgi:DNA-binding transcriptional LysR family regulator
LIDDGIDAAVRIGQLEDSSLVARQVGATRRVLVAAPKYLARHRAPRSLDELRKHDAIALTPITPHSEWTFSQAGRERRVPFAPRFVTNDADAAIVHAELGGGLCMLLAYQVVESVRAARLQLVLPELEPAPLPIHIVYPSTRLLSAKVRAFIDLATAKQAWQFVELRAASAL